MISTVQKRFFAAAAGPQFKVTVVGAAGGIGQPISLLLKQNHLVKTLALYDIVNTPGVAADLSHINTPAKVIGYKGDAELKNALSGSDVVVVPAGVPRKPGMTRDDLFNTNATIVKNIAKAAAEVCPNAHMLIISNPVNSTVPIVAEVFKKMGCYNPKRLFGVTTLDIVRANTFVGEKKTVDPSKVNITVVGGHSGVTIVPLLSQFGLTEADGLADLTKRIQFGGDEVVKAKDGTGSATLSMAFAGARFANRLLQAMAGEKGIVECAYVESSVIPGVKYFASNVELGPGGASRIRELGPITSYEQKLLDAAIPELKANIKKGEDFVHSSK
jgi:malate dehydrogenase